MTTRDGLQSRTARFPLSIVECWITSASPGSEVSRICRIKQVSAAQREVPKKLSLTAPLRAGTDYDNLLEINVDSWSSRSQGPTHRASFYVVPPLRLKPKSGRPSSASSTFSRSSTMTSFSSKLSASTNSAATVMPDVDLATFGNLYAALGNAQSGIDPPETAPSLGTDYWISRVRRVKADMRARRHGLA